MELVLRNKKIIEIAQLNGSALQSTKNDAG